MRVLFCLFAEDTNLFAPDVFTQFIREQTHADGTDVGARLNELFDWLNRPEVEAITDDLDPFHGFRYVNGGLFVERLGFPRFNRAMRDTLLKCCGFQWAAISPAVFGSLFQGVLEDRVRRQQGAHYTSERDIMKVLRSLFLDDLRAEWTRRAADKSSRSRAEMEAFHARLRGLRFLDPACGCGNFLVLAYRELRALETEVVKRLHGTAQQVLDVRQLLRVDVDQFYGIEYSEWPVRIAEVALWLMDHQMNTQAADTFGQGYDRLPLKTSPHIVPGNALRMDWDDVLPRGECSYVLGNPPFVGGKFQSIEQRADMESVVGKFENYGVLDYVCAWYVKAAAYIQDTRIVVGFVSTNSVTQGEQVAPLWLPLFDRFHIIIHFAHRTFSWISESRGKAHVHVVIVGFATFSDGLKFIYDYQGDTSTPTIAIATNINPYLADGPNVVVLNRQTPLCAIPEIRIGNKPIDGGYYLFTAAEKQAFLDEEPNAEPFFRRWLGSEEMINGIERWCLWLGDAAPGVLRNLPRSLERVELVARFRRGEVPAKGREHSERNTKRNKATQKLALTPRRFHVESIPTDSFLAIPKVSSERRAYIPIGFVGAETLASDLLFVLQHATPWHFGILTSSMHMAWVRTVAGRLKSDFRYSAGLVYNNFPWPSPTPAQKLRVEEKAQAVLKAREPHLPPRGLSTLADLYDPLTMPAELAKAHADLDRAVERCYRPEPFPSDRERVELLFRLYEQLTAPLLPATPRVGSRRKVGGTAAPVRRGRTPGLPGRP